MDRPGKDSYRYREAGAGQVLISTAERWALLTETPRGHATLDELLALLAPCDLVIVEGFKSEGRIPRIEVRRAVVADPPIYPQDPNVIAVAADFALECPLPVLDLNDADRIVEFIMQRLALVPSAAPR
jgi:molybdopterin-guanine dinucleotide biosynthesis protein B